MAGPRAELDLSWPGPGLGLDLVAADGGLDLMLGTGGQISFRLGINILSFCISGRFQIFYGVLLPSFEHDLKCSTTNPQVDNFFMGLDLQKIFAANPDQNLGHDTARHARTHSKSVKYPKS